MRFDSGFMETSEKKILSDLKSEKMKIFLTVFEGHLQSANLPPTI